MPGGCSALRKAAKALSLKVRRTGVVLRPNSARVLLREFNTLSDQRNRRIIGHIEGFSEAEVADELAQLLSDFDDRHRHLGIFLLQRFDDMKHFRASDVPLSLKRKLLIGAYFTQEYALEGAALFNPSLVWHPDQSGLPEGERRFIMSLRATGEGHLSSIAFRGGTVNEKNKITLEEPTRYAAGPEHLSYPLYERALFEQKLRCIDHWDELVIALLDSLGAQFTMDDLLDRWQALERLTPKRKWRRSVALHSLLTLARANYEISFPPEQPLSEHVLFPTSPTERNGIEDARFVQFHDDETAQTTYYATYTAYDGKSAVPQLLQTDDFLRFKMRTLNGIEVQNKGMALFPRRIQGRYAMLSRQDNESLFIMFSNDLYQWNTRQLLLKPHFSWELFQLGNCGSPLETKAGWLVLTHGVGAMRKYTLGAILLDLDDPTKVIGKLREPLMTPNTQERKGYVPNVLYSCGAQIHQGELVLPYTLSDSACSVAMVPVAEILGAMEIVTP